MSELTHLNERGEAHMVDVGGKAVTARRALAGGDIYMQEPTLALIEQGGHRKGDVLAIARIAAIMGAKKTADLVPLCHPLALESVEVSLTIDRPRSCVHCEVTVSTSGRTGVEMEALTAVQVALLTVYDMCKAVDRGMTMGNIQLYEKAGGRSGHWTRTR